MKKYLCLGFIFAFVILFATGCESSKGLVGSWEYESSSDYVYTFNKDKTCSYEFFGSKRECTYEDNGSSVTILYDGDTGSSTYDYTIDGDTLTIKDSFGDDVIYVRK